MIKDPYLINLIINVASTVIGGVFLAFIFFLMKEKVWNYYNIVGKWHLEFITKSSSYNDYVNMVLVYDLFLWREGNQIFGTSEKSYEKSVNRDEKLVGKKRTRGNVTGVYEKKYLSADILNLHIHEFGTLRESSYLIQLKVKKNNISGNFDSFIAEQKGLVNCTRKYF